VRKHIYDHMQRFSLRFNVIVVLEGEHILEMGTHSQLIQQDGLYYRFDSVQKQFEPPVELTV
jgi:ABC-type multidrug transport system fused ATPase/permease subunit